MKGQEASITFHTAPWKAAAITLILFLKRILEVRAAKLGGAEQSLPLPPCSEPRFLPPWVLPLPTAGAHAGRVEASSSRVGTLFPTDVPSGLPPRVPLAVRGHSLYFSGMDLSPQQEQGWCLLGPSWPCLVCRLGGEAE